MINDDGDHIDSGLHHQLALLLPQQRGAGSSKESVEKVGGGFYWAFFRSFLVAAFLFIFFILCHLFVQRSFLRWRMVRTVGRKSTSLATNLTFNVSQKSGVQVTNTNTNTNTQKYIVGLTIGQSEQTSLRGHTLI